MEAESCREATFDEMIEEKLTQHSEVRYGGKKGTRLAGSPWELPPRAPTDPDVRN